jgi:ornithine carbamoyltransferase
MDLHGRSLLKEADFTKDEFLSIVDLAGQLRLEKRTGTERQRMTGLNIALIFEKPSTRTCRPSRSGPTTRGRT